MQCQGASAKSHRSTLLPRKFFLSVLIFGLVAGSAKFVYAASDEDLGIALVLFDLFRAARTVISANQDKINDPTLGDKNLSGSVVVNYAIENTIRETGVDPRDADPKSRKGRLVATMMSSIDAAMAANQALINQRGVGFKGFVPAVFARVVTEHFRRNAAGEADIKFTAPPELIRNRKALPDAVEIEVIRSKFQSPDWPIGKFYTLETTVDQRPASRIFVPEYYSSGCLSCHGQPAGEIDITGYPKEGGQLGQLGAVHSYTLYH